MSFEDNPSQVLDDVVDKTAEYAESIGVISTDEKEQIRDQNNIDSNIQTLQEFDSIDDENDENEVWKKDALHRAIMDVAYEYSSIGITENMIREWIYTIGIGGMTQEWITTDEANAEAVIPIAESTTEPEVALEKKDIPKELITYFHLNPECVATFGALNEELGMDLGKVLASYKQFIETKLALPEGSLMNPIDHARMMRNIRKLIGFNLNEMEEVVDDVRDDNDGSLANMQWIINEELNGKLSDIHDSVITSALFYIKWHSDDFQAMIRDEFFSDSKRDDMSNSLSFRDGQPMTRAEEAIMYSGFVHGKINNIKDELINGDIDDADIPSGIFNNNSWFESIIDQTSSIKSQEVLATTSIAADVHGLNDQISFLSKEDEEIEGNAMMCYMGMCCMQMIPYVGAVASVPIDLVDTISSNDATLSSLKTMGIVPDRYNMKKKWFDHAFAAVGIVATAFGAQGLVKGGKVARALSKIRKFSPDRFIKVLRKIGSHFSIDNKTIDALFNTIFKSGAAKHADTTPSKVTRIEDIPVQASHADDVPVQASHADDVPVQASHADDVPVQASHADDIPVQASHADDIPVQASYADDVPVQASYADDVPTHVDDAIEAAEIGSDGAKAKIAKLTPEQQKSLASNLGISVEELNHMDQTQITKLAEKKWTSLDTAEKMFFCDPKQVNREMSQILQLTTNPPSLKTFKSGELFDTHVSQVKNNIRNRLAHFSRLGLIEDKYASTIQKYSVRYTNLIEAAQDKGKIPKSLDAKSVDNILTDIVNKMVYQHIESQKRVLGDHGVRHIIEGNIVEAENIIKQYNRTNPDNPMDELDQLKMLTIHFNHDMGYTVEVARGGFNSTKSHPMFSQHLFEQSSDIYGGLFKQDDLDEMGHIIRTHDTDLVDFVNAPLASTIRLSDNLGLFADSKLPAVLYDYEPNIAIFHKIHLAAQHGISTKALKQDIIFNIQHNMDNLSPDVKRCLIREFENMPDKILSKQPDFQLGMFAGKLEGYRMEGSSMVVSLRKSDIHAQIQSMFHLGQKQFLKLLDDFGIDIDNINDIEQLTDLIKIDSKGVKYIDLPAGGSGKAALRFEFHEALPNQLDPANARFRKIFVDTQQSWTEISVHADIVDDLDILKDLKGRTAHNIQSLIDNVSATLGTKTTQKELDQFEIIFDQLMINLKNPDKFESALKQIAKFSTAMERKFLGV